MRFEKNTLLRQLYFFALINIIFCTSKAFANETKPVHVSCMVTNATVIYAGTLNSGVLKSDDNGKTWKKMNKGLPEKLIYSIAVHDNTIFVGCGGNGIYVSRDNGLNWDSKNVGIANQSIHSIAFIGSNIFAGSNFNGVFLSKDNGNSWTQANNGLKNKKVTCLVTSGTKIFAGTKMGIYSSVDNGSNWSTNIDSLSNKEILSIYIDNEDAYFGTNHGIYKSNKSLTSFTLLDKNLNNCLIKAILLYKGLIFAGTNPFGVLVSSDKGTKWKGMNEGFTNTLINTFVLNGTTLFAGTDFGIFSSVDNGETWQDLRVVEKEKAENKIKWGTLDFTNLGYEIAQPTLKNGVTSLGNWEGLYLHADGVHSSFNTGMASYLDSNRVIFTRGLSISMGYEKYFSLIRSKHFNLFPIIGGGITLNRLQNARKLQSVEFNRNENKIALGFGAYVTAGIGVVFGPVTVQAKVQAMGSFNINKANEYKALQLIPSLTIGIKTAEIFLRPYTITAQGAVSRQEIASQTIIGYKNYSYTTSSSFYTPANYNSGGFTTTTYTTTSGVSPIYHTEYKTVYDKTSASARDVGKHFFIAAGYEGKIDPANTIATKGYVLQSGFRVKKWLFELGYGKGNVGLKDPVKRNGSINPLNKEGQIDPKYSLPRMNGAFMNSERFGFKLGVNLAQYKRDDNFVSSSSEDSKKMEKIEKATEFYGIMLTGGFGVMKLGEFKFADTSGFEAYKNYVNPNNTDDPELLSDLPFSNNGWSRNQAYVSWGANLFYGAASLEYNMYIANGKILTNTLGISFKLPILRVFGVGKKNRPK